MAFPTTCKIIETIGYILIVYINFFPTFTVRKVSTTRNKVLDDGVSLLQLFLSTTIVECVFCITVLIAALTVPALIRRCLSVPSGRGISHGDMIDLNRENIPGFDVREFYVGLVHNLKEMGF